MHLKSFEYFRAITIILIVIGHCYGISGWKIDTIEERVLANLISGSTSLFVFISGFLFHHVFYPKFKYTTFVRKKFINVYVPYLILSILPVAQALIQKNIFPSYYFGSEETLIDQIIKPTILYYWHGGVMVYWYIPFIMATFLISPLYICFIKLSNYNKVAIIAILSTLSVFMHRPIDNISILQSVVYFMPVYMFGILCSMNKDWIYKTFESKQILLFGIVVGLAILQAYSYSSNGNLHSTPFEYNGVDIAYLQKLILCVFLMTFLHKFEDCEFNILKKIAVSSFAIYFLHGWVIGIISMFSIYYSQHYNGYLLLLITPFVIITTYVFAAIIKRIAKSKSRFVIGW